MSGTKPAKLSWAERRKLIKAQYPSIEKLDWLAVFKQDPTIAGAIINDILRQDKAEPGRPGKRPPLDKADATVTVNQLRNDDYALEPFHKAFTTLKGKRSLRHLAHSSGLDKMVIHKLLNGTMEPTIDHIEKIAKALRRHPSYFLEYRVAYVTGILAERMTEYPESSIVQYVRVRDTMKEGLKT